MELILQITILYSTRVCVRVQKRFIISSSCVWVQYGARSRFGVWTRNKIHPLVRQKSVMPECFFYFNRIKFTWKSIMHPFNIEIQDVKEIDVAISETGMEKMWTVPIFTTVAYYFHISVPWVRRIREKNKPCASDNKANWILAIKLGKYSRE